ncbi:hypothetical protein F2Q69_00012435 [Brassica cretica]|uniref:Uncharacterized protein n=1 Tax=Brassica cretica TaxID=69181 RepID=A0A8S9QLP6_BRACR|nr:hypothetical protein F2Q69_00012435 [Brassica cretica]
MWRTFHRKLSTWSDFRQFSVFVVRAATQLGFCRLRVLELGISPKALVADAAIRSATEPEVNPKPYSASQGASQDIRALKLPYLTNQEGLNNEANFYGFYTQ